MTTTTDTTNPFTPDAKQARDDWKAKQASLKASRDAYQSGASKRLAVIHASVAKIGRALKDEAASQDLADAGFRRAYEEAGFQKTPAVQQMLNKRNDAIAISEALAATTARLKEEHGPLFVQANQEAAAYSDAHGRAISAYNQMCALEALEKHGPPILEAIAMLRSMGWGGNLIDELRTKAAITTDDLPRVSHDSIVGPLDLGPLAGVRRLSPVEVQIWQRTYGKDIGANGPEWQTKQMREHVEKAFNTLLNQPE